MANRLPENMGAAAWIRATLAAGTALCVQIGGTANPRIYYRRAPQGTVYPSVLIDHMATDPALTVSGGRAASAVDMNVLVVTQGNMSAAGSVFAYADQLLQGAGGSVVCNANTTYQILGCWQQTPLSFEDVQDGRGYSYEGATYRIWLEGV